MLLIDVYAVRPEIASRRGLPLGYNIICHRSARGHVRSRREGVFGHNLARERCGTPLIARMPPHCVSKVPTRGRDPIADGELVRTFLFFFLPAVVFQLSHVVHSRAVVKRKGRTTEQRTVDVRVSQGSSPRKLRDRGIK